MEASYGRRVPGSSGRPHCIWDCGPHLGSQWQQLCVGAAGITEMNGGGVFWVHRMSGRWGGANMGKRDVVEIQFSPFFVGRRSLLRHEPELQASSTF